MGWRLGNNVFGRHVFVGLAAASGKGLGMGYMGKIFSINVIFAISFNVDKSGERKHKSITRICWKQVKMLSYLCLAWCGTASLLPEGGEG